MAGKQEKDAVVTVNIRRLMGGRGIASIGGLRDAMVAAGFKIGTGTLQRALNGGTGNRLASLDKIAQFFDVAAEQLLQADLGLGAEQQLPLVAMEPQPMDERIRRLLEDLDDIPPSRRNALLDHIHQVAEEAREAAAHHAGKQKVAAARSSSRRSVASVTYGDGNPRQRKLPIKTVTDPFTAEPTERESALYRRIERAPKAEDARDGRPARREPEED